jgi:hydroxymethylbilane synthase
VTERLRVGTRGSPLALAQTEEALAHLRRAHPGLEFETVEIRTHGDEGYREDLGTTLDGKRAFTKRIQEALLDGKVDLAVHSLKDVPTDAVPGLRIAAIPPRGDPRDVLVANADHSLAHLPAGTRVGTSSLRRKAQLLAEWPQLRIVELHGNVGTRLRRLDAKDYDAVVVAAAGLARLGLTERKPQPIDPSHLTPAPGQGALAIETRSADAHLQALLQAIDDPAAHTTTDAERSLSARLGGGCNVPFGALATLEEGALLLRAVVASPDGRRVVRALRQAPVADARATVDAVASRLLEGGADEILREAS